MRNSHQFVLKHVSIDESAQEAKIVHESDSFQNSHQLSSKFWTSSSFEDIQFHIEFETPAKGKANRPFHSSWKVTKPLHETEATVDLDS